MTHHRVQGRLLLLLLRQLLRMLKMIRIVPVVYPASRTICEHYAIHATSLKTAGTSIDVNDL